MSKNPYGASRFSKDPEAMMQESYLLLADWSLGDTERVRLSGVVAQQRGIYDLLCYVRTERDCLLQVSDEIRARIEKIADGLVKDPEQIKTAAWEILEFLDAAKNWRRSPMFKLPRTIDDVDPEWAEEVTSPDRRYSARMVPATSPENVGEVLNALPEEEGLEEEESTETVD